MLISAVASQNRIKGEVKQDKFNSPGFVLREKLIQDLCARKKPTPERYRHGHIALLVVTIEEEMGKRGLMGIFFHLPPLMA